jgi:hypothetical protein
MLMIISGIGFPCKIGKAIMVIVTVEVKNGEATASKTALELFQYKAGAELGFHQARFSQLIALSQASVTARRSYQGIEDEAAEMRDRMKLTDQDIEHRYRDLASSEVCNMVFLKMDDEMGVLGASEMDTLEFFKYCLRVNTIVGTKKRSEIDRISKKPGQTARSLSDTGYLNIVSVQRDKIDQQPAWF